MLVVTALEGDIFIMRETQVRGPPNISVSVNVFEILIVKRMKVLISDTNMLLLSLRTIQHVYITLQHPCNNVLFPHEMASFCSIMSGKSFRADQFLARRMIHLSHLSPTTLTFLTFLCLASAYLRNHHIVDQNS